VTARHVLGREGGRLLVRVLRDMRANIVSGRRVHVLAGYSYLSVQAQEATQDSYATGSPPYAHASAITSEDARIDWKTMSAFQLVRMHHAIGHQVCTFSRDPLIMVCSRVLE
jgi:methionyl-tRNA formyltransferase